MRKNKIIVKKAWWMIGVSLVVYHLMFSVSACSSIECPVENTVATNYQVCGPDGTATAMSDTLWVLTRRSDGVDTLLLSYFVGQTTFSLPISYSHPEDELLFVTADTTGTFTVDTVWLKKDDIPHFESVDCPAHFFHKLTGARCTRHALDSIRIVNTRVDYDPRRTHLQLYFKHHE